MPNNATAKTKSAPKPNNLKKWGGLILLAMLTAIVATALVLDTPNRTLKIGKRIYHLEEVRSEAAHKKGLSGRESLAASAGMLFVYATEEESCFWMKDMNFPLDIIWVNGQKRIVHIEHDLSPLTYPATFCHGQAQYVIELRAGEASKNGLKAGQKLNF